MPPSPIRGARPPRALLQLARLHGIAPIHVGADGRTSVAAEATLLALLRTLGINLDRADEAAERYRFDHSARLHRVLSPVNVCWQDHALQLKLRLPASRANNSVQIDLQLEDGEERCLVWKPRMRDTLAARTVGDGQFLQLVVPLPADLPLGVHRLHLRERSRSDAETALLIHAPRNGHPPPSCGTAVFTPLYSLDVTASGRACAHYGDWSRFAEWLGAQGVDLIGSLPLCAAFLEPPTEPSPYAPASRLFWNEAYLDLAALPDADAARDALPPAAAADGRLIDWSQHAARQLVALQTAADRHFEVHGPGGGRALGDHVDRRPEVLAYAHFRAAQGQHGRDWRSWEPSLRDAADLTSFGGTPAFRRHLYSQWQCQQQLDIALGTMGQAGVEPYLDLPLGSHPDGYDAWRYRDSFLTGCSAGAPPDAFFTLGQDWGFAPLHPHLTRLDGHRYFRTCLQHQLRHCGVLRIDHAMGLHRIWAIPSGLPGDQGCYLQQPAEELYALLMLESTRQRCAVVAEDLGTVPPGTARALEEHDVTSMHVVQFALSPGRSAHALRPRDRDLACINTHDMPSFAAFWSGADIPDRLALGLLDAAGAERESRRRRRLTATLAERLIRLGHRLAPDDPDQPTGPRCRDALRAILLELAGSDARIVVVGLEDLWLELEPQNVPGTHTERPNWRRRTRRDLEQILGDDDLAQTLRSLVEARHRAADQS